MNERITAYTGKSPFIFVSYAHADKPFALPFIAELQERYNVWFDEGIRFGADWEDEIASKLEECAIFLYFITENSLNSPNCKDEISFARDGGKPFVNVMLRSEIVLPRSFKLRYARYQMCILDQYPSVADAINDLSLKMADLAIAVKDGITDVSAPLTENKKDGVIIRPESKDPVIIPEPVIIDQPEKVEEPEEKEPPIFIREGKYIYFGKYPASEVKDAATIDLLSKTAGELPTKEDAKAWKSYRYYADEKASDYMWYIDLMMNGKKYRGVYFNAYRPYYATLSNSSIDSYQDKNQYISNKVYWFSYDPIKWRILREENGTALVLCEDVIDSQPYQITFEKGSGNDFYNDTPGTPHGTYANNYFRSTIRTWLNNFFYAIAFENEQKELVVKTTIGNDSVSTFPDNSAQSNNKNPFACENSDDNVFLVSQQEITSSEFDFEFKPDKKDESRQKKATDYAKCQGSYVNTDSYPGNGFWWLRSPSPAMSNKAKRVDYRGDASLDTVVNAAHYGVVPALRIKLPE